MQNAECRMHNVEMQNAECRMQNANAECVRYTKPIMMPKPLKASIQQNKPLTLTHTHTTKREPEVKPFDE